MDTERDFLNGKKRALQKLDQAINENKVDKTIFPLLTIINESSYYYTSSSCAGRIVLLQLPQIGDKQNAQFLGKWHRIIETNELSSASKNADVGQMWLLAQSPIIHLIAKTTEAADLMLKTAISCGFKNSGLRSIDKKIVVEICSTERLDAPVGKDGVLFCNNEYLKLLVSIANEVLEKSREKLSRFEEKIKKCLSTHKTTKQ
jgi:tRNA wybutosine-synthesizing protein 3